MDRKKLFPIGEVSKLFHISVSSLRRYETIGLLTPAYISPDSGYRYYGPEQFEVLNTIRYLRALDMPLPEIADFLQNRDIDRIEEKLQQQKQAVLQKQQALKRMEQKIDHRLRWLRDAQSAPLDTVCLVQLPACRIVWVSDCLRIGASADMEAPIRKLDRSDAEAVVFLGKVGLGISAEHLQKAQTAQYDGIFLILDREDIYTGETLEDVDWEHLPPGVESVDELYHRAGEFVNYLRVKYAGKCILAVGHGAFNRAILTYLNGGKPADMVDLPIMENTSVIRLSI